MPDPRLPHRLRDSTLWVSTLLAASVACTEEAPTGDTGVLDDAIAICAFGVAPDSLTGFLDTVPSIDEGTTDTSTVVDLGSNPHCASAFGAVYVAVFDSNVVTRYERDAEGRLAETGRVSFQPAGLTSLTGTSRSFVFLSETDALYVDRVSGLVVRWNPTDMTVTSFFEIPGLLVEGEQASLQPVLGGPVDGELLVYGRFVGGGLLLPRSVLVRLDLETEEATVDVDDRCGGLISDVRASDGATYIASAPLVSVYDETNLNEDSPCILRVGAGENAFDREFFVDPRDLVDDNLAGSLLDIGGDSALVLGFDRTIRDPANFLTPNVWASAESWVAYRIDDIKTPLPGTRVEGLPPQTGQVNQMLTLGDQNYLLRVASDLSSSTLQNVTDLEDVRDGLRFEGGVVVDVLPLDE
ncbi:MAG: hypothetical protein AAF211_15950 [Myxococcota bacterium]